MNKNKKQSSSDDELDSLFASSDDNNEKKETKISDLKSSNIKNEKTKSQEKEDNKILQSSCNKESNPTNKKKRKLNDVLKEENNDDDQWYVYTSKYAFQYEEDIPRTKKDGTYKNNKGKYLYLYKYQGKRKDYPNGYNHTNIFEGKKKKKQRDPNAPKAAQNAFFYFLNEDREKARKKLTECKTNKEFLKKMGEVWKGLSDEKKQKYMDIAKKEKNRYEKEIQDYNNNNKIK